VIQSEKKQNHLFETVVVGVDFSNYSKIVLKQAESLSQQLNAKLIVLYVDWVEWQMPSPETFAPTPEPNLEELAQSVRNFYQIQNTERTSILVLHGVISDTILKAAGQYPSPLIVIGSHGKGAVSQHILGSNAEKIALNSPVPVWVHRGPKTVSLKKVLIPTDLSESSHQQIELLKNWSEELPLSLNYLFVKPELQPLFRYPAYQETALQIQDTLEATEQQFRREAASDPFVTVTGDNPSDEIRRAGKDCDVIAMNPHNRSGLFNQFGRVTSKVIRIAENPVLVMRS
jgi:nucleotide-binding universal stress UspA family protein